MMTMKLNNFLNLFALGAALSIAGTGCRHTPVGTTDIGGYKRPAITTSGPGPETLSPGPRFGDQGGAGGSGYGGNPTGPIPMSDQAGHPGWMHDSDTLSAQTIHFDYDKSAIKSSEQSKLDAVFAYLTSHPDKALQVEGNCDERGTEEYNRSLGERRALAGREYLVRKGINPTRIDVETYGKDKPVDTGHDESAFARNRRDDFVVLTAPGR